MYERVKSNTGYPDNLIEAIGIENVTISDIENAMQSEYLDNKDNRYRKFIELYYRDGLTYNQIKEMEPYPISPSRIGQLIRYALHRTRQVLRAKKCLCDSPK